MANPTAMLLASSNMLNHVGLEYYGKMIQSAVARVLKTGKVGLDQNSTRRWHVDCDSSNAFRL